MNTRLGSDLLWRDVRAPRPEVTRGALFVDRDGVLIEEKGFLSDPEKVVLIPGTVELIKAAKARDLAVVEVTNQSGIARGLFGWEKFARVEDRLTRLLAAEGAALDAVFACPFHEDGQGEYRVPNHAWRKPNPGMLFEAARLLNLDLGRSCLIGDRKGDIQAAKNAGLPFAIQVRTGYGAAHAAESLTLEDDRFRVISVSSAREAAGCLV
jgi:D-glycero-D-manno-heptose 1,7-bisphosphate phosphatase